MLSFSSLTLLAAAVPFVAATNCKNGLFWYNNKGLCLSVSGGSSFDSGTAPSGTACPSSTASWFWSKSNKCCLPGNSNHNDNPTCPSGYTWSQSASTCLKTPASTTPSNSCNNNEFWWSSKGCCLPHGGPSTPQPPPSGSHCPGNWSWSTKLGCCAPHQPPSGSPSCPNSWDWCSQIFQCQPPPPPQPSGHPRRALKSRTASLCPSGLTACPIQSAKGVLADYDCLDTTNQLDSCGGCTSLGKGEDCTVIANAKSVGCADSTCAVYSCSAGFIKSTDGKSCIPEIAGRGL